ncbi:MAG: class III extradiol ring-cleavage dioxygenase [Spirochaetota bacterium]
MATESRARILYIPHGGGPLPLLGDEGHLELVGFLRSIAASMAKPKAIIVVSAHWEASVPTVTAGAFPALIYDYYGFPDEAYRLRYPAPGDPDLAGRIKSALDVAGLSLVMDTDRGFDHGLFVPLSLMYPEADIPCVQLSLVRGLDPALHLRIGQALAALVGEDILILGSGFSFHNMQEFFWLPGTSGQGDPRNDAFQTWLAETCGSSSLEPLERLERLAAWEAAPHARYCHPREEHLLPLHVCAGMAIGAGSGSAGGTGGGPGSAGGTSARCLELTVLGKRSLVAFWDSDR